MTNPQPPKTPGESEADYCSRVFHIYDLDGLKEKAAEAAAQQYIVQHLVPTTGVVGGFGDSGLGKTPFVYQMLLCVATGQPFLGLEVAQSSVLYLGYEDSTFHTNSVLEQQMIHLGISEQPKNFHVWSVNDASPDYGNRHKFQDLVETIKPGLVVLDPIASFFEAIEDSATNATKAISSLRAMCAKVGCVVFFLHHLKKAREESGDSVVTPLEEIDLATWLQRARGSNAIVSAIDTRVVFGRPSNRSADLLVRGRCRGQDEFPMLILSRDMDDEGDILGYTRMTGAELVTNMEYRDVLAKMPEMFRFKDAVRITGKAKSTIALFCKSALSSGMVKKEPGKFGRYYKVPQEENLVVPATPKEREIVLGTNNSSSGRFAPSGTSEWARWVQDWDHTRLNEVGR